MKLTGVLKDHEGTHLSGVAGVLFSIYDQPKDGVPLWQEVQNVELDYGGRFTALAGSTKSDGIPADLFTATKTRWLAIEVLLPGEMEQPRIRLTSVSQGLVTAPSVGFATSAANADQPASTAAQ